MDIPYIRLAQDNVEPSVLQAVLDWSWDSLTEATQLQIIDELKDAHVKFEL